MRSAVGAAARRCATPPNGESLAIASTAAGSVGSGSGAMRGSPVAGSISASGAAPAPPAGATGGATAGAGIPAPAAAACASVAALAARVIGPPSGSIVSRMAAASAAGSTTGAGALWPWPNGAAPAPSTPPDNPPITAAFEAPWSHGLPCAMFCATCSCQDCGNS